MANHLSTVISELALGFALNALAAQMCRTIISAGAQAHLDILQLLLIFLLALIKLLLKLLVTVSAQLGNLGLHLDNLTGMPVPLLLQLPSCLCLQSSPQAVYASQDVTSRECWLRTQTIVTLNC